MNLPTPKQRSKHYQCIRAFSDGWGIEVCSPSEQYRWIRIENPPFYANREYRIVPDENGWLPWYATENSVCPSDYDSHVDILTSTSQTFEGALARAHYWRLRGNTSITHYRPHKERKLVRAVKYYDDGTEEEMMLFKV